jgi:hypothetical protein
MDADDVVFETEDLALAKEVVAMFNARNYKRVSRVTRGQPEFTHHREGSLHCFSWYDGKLTTPIQEHKAQAELRSELLIEIAKQMGSPIPLDRDELAVLLTKRGCPTQAIYMSKYLARVDLNCKDRRKRNATQALQAVPLPTLPQPDTCATL